MWRLDVELLQVAVLVAASLPRTSRKKRAFLPSRSGGAASGGAGLAPAVHAPPPLSMRDLTRGKAKAPRAPSVAFRIVQGSVLPFWRCAVRLLQRPRTQEQRAPWASLHSRSRRSAHQTANGSRRHGCEASNATRDGHEFGSMSTIYGIREEGAIVGDRN